jgi:peptidylprolyl isomerase
MKGGGGAQSKNNVYLWFATERRFKKAKGQKNVEEDDPAEMGDALLGRVVLALDDEDTPRTAKNFRWIASGEKGKSKSDSSKQLCYKDSPIHRVVAGKLLQGGDFVKGTGACGESIFGAPFKDEPKGLKKRFDQPGLLAMANSGKNSNTSQFFLTLAPLPQLDGQHVVFGRVVEGQEVLQRVAAYHALHDDGKEGWKDVAPVFVWKCGVCE